MDNLQIVLDYAKSAGMTPQTTIELVEAYYPRAYHNLQHIAEMLVASERYRKALSKYEFRTLTSAILWHDYYQTDNRFPHFKNSNEFESVTLAAGMCQYDVRQTDLIPVILATDYFSVENDRFRKYEGLPRIIRDLDLMGLAHDPDLFKWNNERVAKEHGVPPTDPIYRANRHRVLTRLVEGDLNLFDSFPNRDDLLLKMHVNIDSLKGPTRAN